MALRLYNLLNRSASKKIIFDDNKIKIGNKVIEIDKLTGIVICLSSK